MDMEIALDMLRLAPQIEHAILFSGDGDFCRLLEDVQGIGVVSVVSTTRPRPRWRRMRCAAWPTSSSKWKICGSILRARRATADVEAQKRVIRLVRVFAAASRLRPVFASGHASHPMSRRPSRLVQRARSVAWRSGCTSADRRACARPRAVPTEPAARSPAMPPADICLPCWRALALPTAPITRTGLTTSASRRADHQRGAVPAAGEQARGGRKSTPAAPSSRPRSPPCRT